MGSFSNYYPPITGKVFIKPKCSQGVPRSTRNKKLNKLDKATNWLRKIKVEILNIFISNQADTCEKHKTYKGDCKYSWDTCYTTAYNIYQCKK